MGYSIVNFNLINTICSIIILRGDFYMDFDSDINSSDARIGYERYEYKVLVQKDKWFSSKIDPVMLENTLNTYSANGWRVISCATADILGIRRSRQEFIAVLERQVK